MANIAEAIFRNISKPLSIFACSYVEASSRQTKRRARSLSVSRCRGVEQKRQTNSSSSKNQQSMTQCCSEGRRAAAAEEVGGGGEEADRGEAGKCKLNADANVATT